MFSRWWFYPYTTNENLAKLQMIQNNACRIILREGSRASILGMHHELKLNTLCDRRLFRASMYMYKCMNGFILDKNLINMFDPLALQHGVDTRAHRRDDLVIVQTRTQMGDRAFFGVWCQNMELVTS